MPVLTIASRKGGTGKSTTSVAIASMLDAEGVDVGLLDTDPNQGAYRWATQKYGGTTLKAYAESDTEKLADLLPTLAARHAVLIVDTAGFGNQAATVAMAGADGVLVPVTPGEGDVVEAGRTVGFVEGLAKMARRPIPVRVLPNRLRRSTTLTKHVLAEMDANGLPRLKASLSEAVSYGEMSFSDALPRSGTAAGEVEALVAELRELRWLPEKGATSSLRKEVKA
ncbi:MAG: division plane positioning ATPase MipZ [Janthinobacterium lividum]